MLLPMHPAQVALESEHAIVWRAALADASIQEDNALLFVFPGTQSAAGHSALCWLPGIEAKAISEGEPVQHALLAMNQEEGIGAYRVAVWTTRSIEGLGALLRHELEHARQLEAHG